MAEIGRGGLCGRRGRALSTASILSILSIPRARSTCPCDHCIRGLWTTRYQFRAPQIVPIPQRQSALTQKIFIVQPQFLQTRACHIGQLQFSFLAGRRRHTSFGDVLHPTPCCLHHLIVSASAFSDVTITKTRRDIVNQLPDLKALEISISTVLRDQHCLC